MTAITTSGQAKQVFAADQATVYIQLNLENKNHKDVASEATKLHNTFADTLRELAEASKLTKLTISQLSVRSQERWHEKKPEKFFVANSSFSFSMTDFKALEELLGKVSQTEGLSESSLNWGLSDEQISKVLPEIQREALRNAISKAENFAKELGAKSVRILAVYEPGIEPPKPRGYAQPMVRMAAYDAAPESAPSIEASEITLSANINIDAETAN